MRAELKQETAKLKEKGIVPGLGVILVGEDPASKSYVTAKERACEEIGIYSDDNRLPAETSQRDLLALVEKMNNDPKINGILVQLPLPKGLDESEVLLAIDPAKDVDGFHPMNVGKMVVGEKAFLPCTPHGVIQLLIRSNVKLEGAEVVIVGRSNIVGKPMAALLLNAFATVDICHIYTKDLASHTRKADILVVGVGKAGLITEEMVKEGAVVIDIGINRLEDGSLVGDVDYEAVAPKCSYITPVPGGVGPMTIAMLLKNTVKAAKERA